MKALIKITEQNGQQAVSARELHSFLESKQDFSTWIKNRIEKYGFIEEQDFTLHKFVERGTWKHEYVLSIDTAKELAMVEGNEKGKQARRYFIECEKKLRTGAYALPQTFAEALKLAAQQAERIELQQAELKKQAPKVAYYEEVLQSESTYNTNQIAKELGMSAITLNKKLQDLKVQYRQGGTWLLYHKYQNKGYTKTKTHTYTDTKGATQTSMQTVWTEKGRLFIHEALSKRLQSA
ncbi:phage antirepressor KilAC domain-containing protein [Riemerella anatipestifer]|uniref:Phage antirepressor KilAC domain-containing protein n=1 Tax=Riemerella anatipestifer TaxID=34085 RepID=A0AAP3AR32_RIEAN|nr:phage antirepressor KilAC domain-containing protein [Riemerella anatipestifer]WCS66394.1 antirepressor protein [Riemerella phage vB_RanS_CRP5]WIL01296.1 antirepressor protein [Riemerella phage vB_RanS_CRP6]MBT0572515.1 phage antirepressor KilAC domain-containing protein [Riemerella anatipestifer]MCU7568770.1 phage antirepressor KilAC domain-containing protein [Riemerella anatipestifer]MCW0491278.1 phage antirepressor KilAC domain-containing protein [Riemerella anatipestifer]